MLYDPDDGRIVHQHEVVNFVGAEMADDEQLVSRALALAARMGQDVSTLRPLHFSSDEYEQGKMYRIDTKTLRLAEIQVMV